MSESVTLQIPDDVYETLKRLAREQGRSPEDAGAEWLSQAVRRAGEDPLDAVIGILATDVPGWADRHDEYLGATLAREAGGQADEAPQPQ